MGEEWVFEEVTRRLKVLEDLSEREFLEEEARKFELVRHINENCAFVFRRIKTPFKLSDFDESSGLGWNVSIICCSIVLVSFIYFYFIIIRF